MQFPLNIRCVPKAGNLRLICIYNLILDFLCENSICTRFSECHCACRQSYSAIFHPTQKTDKLCITVFFEHESCSEMWAVLCVCESIEFGSILKAFGAYMSFSAVKLNACHTTGCEAQQNVAQCSLKERDWSPVHMADCISKRGEARRRCIGWCAP